MILIFQHLPFFLQDVIHRCMKSNKTLVYRNIIISEPTNALTYKSVRQLIFSIDGTVEIGQEVPYR